MDVASFLSALIVALITTFGAIWYNHYLEKETIKKGFISELLINAEIMKRSYEQFRVNKIGKSYPILHTVVYEDIRRKGILYELPEELRTQIVNLYNNIIAFNTASNASIYGLVPIDPEKATSALSLMLSLVNNILQRLKQLWKM